MHYLLKGKCWNYWWMIRMKKEYLTSEPASNRQTIHSEVWLFGRDCDVGISLQTAPVWHKQHIIWFCLALAFNLNFKTFFQDFSSITAHVNRSLSSLPFLIPIVCFWLVLALFVLIILSTSNMKTAVWSGYTYYYAVYHIGLRLLSGIFYHLDWTEVQMLTWG